VEILREWFEQPWAESLGGLSILFLAAWLARVVFGAIAERAMHALVARTSWQWDDLFVEHKAARRLVQAIPSLVVQFGLRFVHGLSAELQSVIGNVALATTLLFLMLAASGLLDALQAAHGRAAAARASAHSIKGYVQLVKIVIFVLGTIVIVATLIDRSPLILLSGLGAMSAVLLLVFKDTLLSLVASVQLTSNDMLRVGDWIEMPQVGADGAVIEIALHTVKVQNWDKTITTIPTWRLIGESFRNWRGMSQSGGRRIKRAIRLDASGVRFLDEADINRLKRIHLLYDYLDDRQHVLEEANRQLEDSYPANSHRLTNIGTFRAYAQAYLDAHAELHKEMTCVVRLLEPMPDGIPIELYCFTATTEWVLYERIQGDVFDHLIAILPEFGLSLYQNPSGLDLRMAFERSKT
jgi:miniconductance mechanosensitive channel